MHFSLYILKHSSTKNLRNNLAYKFFNSVEGHLKLKNYKFKNKYCGQTLGQNNRMSSLTAGNLFKSIKGEYKVFKLSGGKINFNQELLS